MEESALVHAAQVLVHTVLKVRAGERTVIVQDAASAPMAEAIAWAAESCGAWVKCVRIDAVTSAGGSGRPHKVMPDPLVLAIHDGDASVYLASALPTEAPMRQAFLHAIRQRRVRHAHMPGVTQEAFVAGLRVDYADVARLGRRVLARLAGTRTLVAESDAGTSLRVELAPRGLWFAQLGLLEAGQWGALPAGAVYSSPVDASGVFVANASVGEFFGTREGLLRQRPVRFLVERGRVVDVEVRTPALRRDIEAMLAVSSNSARVGLVAIGVNPGIGGPVGDAAVDQNLPGMHIGIGDPAGKSTGATWTAPTCFAACQAVSRVLADGEPIVDGGRVIVASERRMAAVSVAGGSK